MKEQQVEMLHKNGQVRHSTLVTHCIFEILSKNNRRSSFA
jgi:hypothetical protein